MSAASLLSIGSYERVNGSWPTQLPELTPQEAVSAARRLYRFGVGRRFEGSVRVTSGNRYTWTRRGVLYVNPEKGWTHLVHDLSHYAHRRKNPHLKPHEGHAWLEREMIEHVISRGWLDGKLKREQKPSVNPTVGRYTRLCERIERWERKLQRAQTALKKLRKSKARYDRLRESA